MEVMNEKTRKDIIFKSHKFGGISLRNQKLRVHKNGAKFPISKVYVDDEILDPELAYTLVLIPEVKIATKSAVVLNYFHRRIGPTLFYSYPDDALTQDETGRIAEVMTLSKAKESFFVHQSSVVSSLNYYFEIPSDWARGNKEMLLLTVILDKIITKEIEEKIQTICVEFVSRLKKNTELYKALYFNVLDKFSAEEKLNIKKVSSNLRTQLKGFYEKVIVSS